MKKRVGILIAITLTAWAVAVYPARAVWGDSALIHSAVAVALCLIPTSATMLWADWASRGSPEHQLVMVLGGTGVRMGGVLGVALLLYTSVPFFEQPAFWIWLLVFYLLTLALEIILVVKSQPAAGGQQEMA